MTKTENHGGFSSVCKKLLISLVIIMIFGEVYYVDKLERSSRPTSRGQEPYMTNDRRIYEEPPKDTITMAQPSSLQHGNQTIATQTTTKPELRHDSPEELLEAEVARQLEKASDKKIILVWNVQNELRASRTVNRKKCGECELTFDRSMINDERTLAVVFHFKSIQSDDMPSPRNPKQLHIFFTAESSATLKVTRRLSLKFEDSYKFNATMTHRLDSTFLSSYQNPILADKLMGKDESIYAEIMKTKRKFAMAMISDCHYTNGARMRMKKIQELKNFGLSLDCYGACFGHTVDKKSVPQLIKQYKFYFSYENSYHCKDYITEKLFQNALAHHSIPVVWGGTKEDYEAIAPPGSYIFSDDFKTSLKLIEYLRFLDQNEEEYLKYFKWMTMKPEVLPQYKRARKFCAICRELHGIHVDARFNPKYLDSKRLVPMFTDGLYPRTVPSLSQWFYGEDKTECFAI